MGEMRCDQCVYWEPDEARHAGALIVGQCNRALPFWDATEWDEDYTGRSLKPEFVGRRFFAQDGSDYRAIVLTAPDFYCADFNTTSVKAGNRRE